MSQASDSTVWLGMFVPLTATLAGLLACALGSVLAALGQLPLHGLPLRLRPLPRMPIHHSRSRSCSNVASGSQPCWRAAALAATVSGVFAAGPGCWRRRYLRGSCRRPCRCAARASAQSRLAARARRAGGERHGPVDRGRRRCPLSIAAIVTTVVDRGGLRADRALHGRVRRRFDLRHIGNCILQISRCVAASCGGASGPRRRQRRCVSVMWMARLRVRDRSGTAVRTRRAARNQRACIVNRRACDAQSRVSRAFRVFGVLRVSERPRACPCRARRSQHCCRVGVAT